MVWILECISILNLQALLYFSVSCVLAVYTPFSDIEHCINNSNDSIGCLKMQFFEFAHVPLP